MNPIQGNVSIDAQNIMPIIKKWLYSDKDIFLRERGTAEKLIEEFMLITNTTVAEYIASTGVASLYRSHEDPDKEKIEQFKMQMNLMGHSIRLKDDYYSSILNRFLMGIRGEEEILS